MHQYRAMVKAGGIWVETVVFAENVVAALKLVQAQYGIGNVSGTPTQIR